VVVVVGPLVDGEDGGVAEGQQQEQLPWLWAGEKLPVEILLK
jgi:hypothetical protein